MSNNATDSGALVEDPVAAKKARDIANAKKEWSNMISLLHFMFHGLWLQLYLMIGRIYISFVGGPITTYNRKIVIAGDDMALGVGDWVTFFSYPGLHRRLNDTINSDFSTRLTGRGVFWNAYDGGKSRSTTKDWLPERDVPASDKLKRKWKLIGARNIFESLFDPNVGEHRNADIVVLTIGNFDRCEPKETKQNLVKIIVELLRRNHCVVMLTMPMYPSKLKNKDDRDLQRQRNEAIREAVASVQATLSEERVPMLRLCDIERDAPLATDIHYRFDGAYLSGRGYDTVVKPLQEQLIPLMRHVLIDRALPKVSKDLSHFR